MSHWKLRRIRTEPRQKKISLSDGVICSRTLLAMYETTAFSTVQMWTSKYSGAYYYM